MTAKQLLILGEGIALRQALEAAHATDAFTNVVAMTLEAPDGFNYALPAELASVDKASTWVFTALDDAHLNLRRLGFLARLANQGLSFANLTAPSAVLAQSVRLLGNVYVGPGSVLAVDCQVGFGCWIDAGVVVGAESHLGEGCTLHARTIVGANCHIGQGTVVGSGARLMDDCRTGHHCELMVDQAFSGEIPDRSFFQPGFIEGARIYNLRGG